MFSVENHLSEYMWFELLSFKFLVVIMQKSFFCLGFFLGQIQSQVKKPKKNPGLLRFVKFRLKIQDEKTY